MSDESMSSSLADKICEGALHGTIGGAILTVAEHLGEHPVCIIVIINGVAVMFLIRYLNHKRLKKNKSQPKFTAKYVGSFKIHKVNNL